MITLTNNVGRQPTLDILVQRWQGLEDKTIWSACNIADKVSDPFVRAIMKVIRHDSQKHKIILQSIKDIQNNEALHFSADESRDLSLLLSEHMSLQAESIDVAIDTLTVEKPYATAFLLSTLMEEEMIHKRMLSELLERLT